MTKKPNRKSVPRSKNDEIELRRWCIDTATRWPVQTYYPNAGQLGAVYNQFTQEADVIGRAKRIYEWVTAA